jgi:hypothetical protein
MRVRAVVGVGLLFGAVVAACNGPFDTWRLSTKSATPGPELALGGLAPEIEGEDLFGAKLKLSDYRGKVVLLDFWGTW